MRCVGFSNRKAAGTCIVRRSRARVCRLRARTLGGRQRAAAPGRKTAGRLSPSLRPETAPRKPACTTHYPRETLFVSAPPNAAAAKEEEARRAFASQVRVSSTAGVSNTWPRVPHCGPSTLR
ncbi:hypothetical protein MRX96_019662 [Rhipicephalus microplus]